MVKRTLKTHETYRLFKKLVDFTTNYDQVTAIGDLFIVRNRSSKIIFKASQIESNLWDVEYMGGLFIDTEMEK